MFSWYEPFRSVEAIWILWGLCLVALVLSFRLASRGAAPVTLRTFHREEAGGAYSMSYILTFPFFLILVCLIIECSLILFTKLGTMYAAFAATRAAIVWQPANDRGLGPGSYENVGVETLTGISGQLIRQAACQAMMPFASGDALHQKMALQGMDPKATTLMVQSGLTCVPAGENLTPNGYFLRKFNFAFSRSVTRVNLDVGEGLDRTCQVVFKNPFYVKRIGDAFFELGILSGDVDTEKDAVSNVSYYPIRSIATLDAEIPRSVTGKLGIGYCPAYLRDGVHDCP